MNHKDPLLTEAVQKIQETVKPKKVYLFGSRARGDNKSNSDYDLLIVVSDQFSDKLQRREIIHEALKDIKASIDFFIYTESEFDSWKGEFSSIPETALHEGVELDLA